MGTLIVKSNLLVYGAGGHAKVIIDAVRRSGGVVSAIIDDDPVRQGEDWLGIKILSPEEFLANRSKYRIDGCIIAIGHNNTRIEKAAQCYEMGYRLQSVMHPSAIVSPTAKLGDGTVLCAGSVINADSVIGNNTIINTHTTIEHDCWVGNNVHIAPRVCLGGSVQVEDGAFIGMGACVLPNLRIGQNAVVGAGAVVTRDLPSQVTAFGVPARIVQ